jgi:hypothetical protein
MSIFFANGLVAGITLLAIVMLFWAPLRAGIARLRGR